MNFFNHTYRQTDKYSSHVWAYVRIAKHVCHSRENSTKHVQRATVHPECITLFSGCSGMTCTQRVCLGLDVIPIKYFQQRKKMYPPPHYRYATSFDKITIKHFQHVKMPTFPHHHHIFALTYTTQASCNQPTKSTSLKNLDYMKEFLLYDSLLCALYIFCQNEIDCLSGLRGKETLYTCIVLREQKKLSQLFIASQKSLQLKVF